MTDVTPIRTLLSSLNGDEHSLAERVLISYLHAIYKFPRPIGIVSVKMTQAEQGRYEDGWQAAMEANSFLVAALTGLLDEFISTREGS